MCELLDGCFNPRPAIARGAITAMSYDLTEEGFQSAPRDCSRGDTLRPKHRGHRRCFNPRPAIARGAIFTAPASRPGMASFNPRPAIARGAIQAE